MFKYEKSNMETLYEGIVRGLPEVKAMSDSYCLAVANTIKFIEDFLDVLSESGHSEIKIKDLKGLMKSSIIDSNDDVGTYYSKLQIDNSILKGEKDHFKKAIANLETTTT